jgi:glycosyltransferase involved in cell wall biosynthesis
MHILFLSQVLPYPLDAGPKMRSYYVLRHLARSHRVTLLAFTRDSDRPEDVAHLESVCHAVHTVPMRRSRLGDVRFLGQSLASRRPFLIARDHAPAMAGRVREMAGAGGFDAIHADQLWMALYALAGAEAARPRPRLVLDQHNAVHLIPRRLAEGETNPIKQKVLAREARLLAAYEPEVCRRFDHVVWVTEEDRGAVAACSDGASGPPSSVIPICADPSAVAPVAPAPVRRRVTFLGGLHWPPNAQGIRWFARHVFPQVRAEAPGAALTVIGKSPPAGLEGEGVEVTGYVGELAPYLAETGAFVVPLHAGGGMRVKILDAWSWGLPVVSTTIGAEGIVTRPGEDILIADNARDFAQAVVAVLEDRALAERIGRGGRRTVEERYDWRSAYAAWDEVYPGN